MTSADHPEALDLAPEVVLIEMAEAGAERSMSLSGWQVLILSSIAGGFMTQAASFTVRPTWPTSR